MVSAYNRRIHSPTKFRPIDITPENQQFAFRALYNVNSMRDLLKRQTNSKRFVGDHVRISKHQNVFSRGFKAGWSEEVFKIAKLVNKGLSIPQYSIVDWNNETVKGRFYPTEIQHINTTPHTRYLIEAVLNERGRGRNKEILVKWWGYPESSNSWIPQSEMTDA